MEFLKRFWTEAKDKWTTWVALAMSGLAGLPEVLPQSWDQIAYFVPAKYRETVHHLLLAAGFLGIIYLRVRRNVANPTA